MDKWEKEMDSEYKAGQEESFAQCTLYTVNTVSNLYSVQDPVYTLQCTLYILWVVQSTMHRLIFEQCILWALLVYYYTRILGNASVYLTI